MENTIKCSVCKELKLITNFYKKDKNNYSNRCKSCLYEFQKERWKDRKRKMLELLGGKCVKCGYCKNTAALHIHHIDPSLKENDWTDLRQMKWSSIIIELKKCILLCANCHAEHHWPENNYDQKPKGIDNKLLNKELKPTGVCPFCNGEVFGTKYCSVECAGFSQQKVKRPDRQTLLELVWEKPTSQIAKDFKVSDVSIANWCRLYGIVKPTRGYWKRKSSG